MGGQRRYLVVCERLQPIVQRLSVKAYQVAYVEFSGAAVDITAYSAYEGEFACIALSDENVVQDDFFVGTLPWLKTLIDWFLQLLDDRNVRTHDRVFSGLSERRRKMEGGRCGWFICDATHHAVEVVD